jgi:hypothetical protein
MLSDQEVHNTISKITDTKNLFSMSGFSFKQSPYKSKRAELIGEAVKDINSLRVGTKFKPLTDRLLAIKINKNPFLKSDGELSYVLDECKNKRNYAKLFWLLK